MSLEQAMIRSDAMLAATTLAAAACEDVHPGQWTEVLHSGHYVLIRPIRKQDMALEQRFIERLSPQSRRFRFLGAMQSPSSALLKQLVDIDPVRDVALVALTTDETEEREIGVARLSADADGRNCEFAVAVSDEWQQRGLGTLLMQRLVDNARARGLRSMSAISAVSNVLMRDLAKHRGFLCGPDPNNATQVLYSLDLNTLGIAAV